MAKSGGGGGGQGGQPGAGQEMTILISVILAGIACWIIWNHGRAAVIYPVFGVAWGEYWILHHIGRLDETGESWFGYVTTALNGRRDHYSIEWQDLRDMMTDIGSRCALVLALTTAVLAGVAAMRMRGDGFRRQFSLTGREQKTIYRIAKWKGLHGLISFLASTPKILPTYWLYKILSLIKVIKGRKEWAPKGVSFIHYQAQEWKVASISANFDPDKGDPTEGPSLKPLEWLRDNKIALTKRDHLDEVAAANAFERQLGPHWNGLESAAVHVQAMAVMAIMNLQQKKEEVKAFRYKLADIYVNRTPAAAEPLVRKLMAPYIADKKMVEIINNRASRHAFTNTALIGLVGWGGPFQNWGGGTAGVMAPPMYRWLKKVDRTMWYALNNIGRRSFLTEGAGAISHFLAERVSKESISEPYLDGAVDGILTYIDEQGVEDLETYFRKDKDAL